MYLIEDELDHFIIPIYKIMLAKKFQIRDPQHPVVYFIILMGLYEENSY